MQLLGYLNLQIDWSTKMPWGCFEVIQEMGYFNGELTYHDAQPLTARRNSGRFLIMSNQRAIAAALGLTQATVSRALRDDPSIPPETRKRISDTAHQLGYRPNALVSALMEHVRAGKSIQKQGCIAILVDASSQDECSADESFKRQLEGLVAEAQLHGYRTEFIFLRAKGQSEGRVERILNTEGVTGIVLASPTKNDFQNLDFRWERYAIATIGCSLDFVRVDRACSDLGFNMSYVYDELLRRQYRRIGLCLPPWAIKPQDNHQLAGYLEKQYHQPELDRIPVFIGSIKTDPVDKFREWYDRWHPDALICLQGEELGWIEQMGLSPLEDLGLVCLNRPLGSEFTGIEENNVLIGKIACDIIVNHITRNELGLPMHPRRILVEGTWREGVTLPRRRPTNRTV